MLAFWGGLSLLESDSEWSRFLYCLINLSFMLIAVLFQRKIFIVFGAIGVFGYIGYLAARDSRTRCCFHWCSACSAALSWRREFTIANTP